MSKEEKGRIVTPPSPTPICSACFDFTADGRSYEKRTIVIVPIIIEEKALGFFQIGWACSRGVSCQDSSCRYSSVRKRKYANEEAAIEHLGTFGDR